MGPVLQNTSRKRWAHELASAGIPVLVIGCNAVCTCGLRRIRDIRPRFACTPAWEVRRVRHNPQGKTAHVRCGRFGRRRLRRITFCLEFSIRMVAEIAIDSLLSFCEFCPWRNIPSCTWSADQARCEGIERERAKQVAPHPRPDFVRSALGGFDPVEADLLGHCSQLFFDINVADQLCCA